MKNIFEGKRVRLRAVEPQDWETHYLWNLDSEMARHLYFIPFPQSAVAARQWAEDQAKKAPEQDVFRFQIETLAGNIIGTINTADCQPRMGTFSYGVAVMADQRRQGYASEAILLMLRYFFLELRYQKCTTVVYDFNPPSIALHQHLGFVHEGTLRRMLYTAGNYHDIHYYGMTREEFAEKHADYVYEI